MTYQLLNAEYHKAIVSDVQEINPGIKSIFLEFPHPVKFQSGQFVIIDFQNLNHQFSTRSYSIADFTWGNVLELCVVLKKDGAATPLLFDKKKGDELLVSNPQGRFVLPEELDEKILGFICTGTGVAPFRAMIKDLLLHRGHKGEIQLFFGCRTQADLLYYREFIELSNRFPNFKYTPVLSREHWEGAKGYVHPYYQKIFESKPPALIYLCGWTEMIKETRDKLKSFGYTRTEIKIEFYD